MDPQQVENNNRSDYNEQDFVPEEDRNQTPIPLPPWATPLGQQSESGTIAPCTERDSKTFRDATNGAATAACPAPRETNLVRVDPFHSTEYENPLEQIEAFERAVDANNQCPDRKVRIASGYLRGVAANDAARNSFGPKTKTKTSFKYPKLISEILKLRQKPETMLKS